MKQKEELERAQAEMRERTKHGSHETQDYSHLLTWIPEQLNRVGLTPEQLAHRAGINRISVYRYISDADRPSRETMLKICSVLNISAEEGLSQYTPKKNGRPWASEGSKRVDLCEHEVTGKSVRPRISMDVRGRFGQLFATAVNKKVVSLRQVAAKFDYSYEQMRKLVQGRSYPSDELLRGLCRYLDLEFDEALKAANADRIEQRYGTNEAYAMIGKSPRLADIEPYLSQLTDSEWQMFVTQIAGYVRQRHRTD